MVNLRTLDCQELHFSTRLRLADEAVGDEAEPGAGDEEAMSDDEAEEGGASATTGSNNIPDIDMDSPVNSQQVLLSSPNKDGLDLG